MTQNKFFNNLDKVKAFLVEADLSLEELHNIIMLIFKVNETSEGSKNIKLKKTNQKIIFKNDPKELCDLTENFFKSTNCEPCEVKTILRFFKKENFNITGINKGAALGAALRGDNRFIFQRQDKLWQLK